MDLTERMRMVGVSPVYKVHSLQLEKYDLYRDATKLRS